MDRNDSLEAIIAGTLDRAATACEDPTALIYDRLFAMHPEFETLFSLDTDGGVRGAMLQTAIDCLIDLAGEGRSASAILASERMNHDGYGVPPDTFAWFFGAIRDTVRELNANDWTAAEEAAWSELLGRLDVLPA